MRSGEYLGIYLRLLVIGGLLIYFVPNQWLKLIFAILFIYMIFLQIVPLWKHHATLVWLDLYPIAETVRKQAFMKWMQQLIAVVAILFTLFVVIIGEMLIGALLAVASLLFVLIVIPNYLRKKLEV